MIHDSRVFLAHNMQFYNETTLEVCPGARVERCAAMAIKVLRDWRLSKVKFDFNGIMLTVVEGSTEESITADYFAGCEKLREAYNAKA